MCSHDRDDYLRVRVFVRVRGDAEDDAELQELVLDIAQLDYPTWYLPILVFIGVYRIPIGQRTSLFYFRLLISSRDLLVLKPPDLVQVVPTTHM